MKNILVFTLFIISMSSCKKYCYTCVDANGQELPGQKCFASEEDMFNYQYAQAQLNSNQPHCQ